MTTFLEANQWFGGNGIVVITVSCFIISAIILYFYLKHILMPRYCWGRGSTADYCDGCKLRKVEIKEVRK
jgi:hypothetical protein